MNEKRIRLHLIDSVQNFKAYFQSSVRMFRHTISTLLELVCWGRISIFRVNTLLQKLRLIYSQRRLWPFSSSPVSKDYLLSLDSENSTTASLIQSALIRDSRANNHYLIGAVT